MTNNSSGTEQGAFVASLQDAMGTHPSPGALPQAMVAPCRWHCIAAQSRRDDAMIAWGNAEGLASSAVPKGRRNDSLGLCPRTGIRTNGAL